MENATYSFIGFNDIKPQRNEITQYFKSNENAFRYFTFPSFLLAV